MKLIKACLSLIYILFLFSGCQAQDDSTDEFDYEGRFVVDGFWMVDVTADVGSSFSSYGFMYLDSCFFKTDADKIHKGLCTKAGMDEVVYFNNIFSIESNDGASGGTGSIEGLVDSQCLLS